MDAGKGSITRINLDRPVTQVILFYWWRYMFHRGIKIHLALKPRCKPVVIFFPVL